MYTRKYTKARFNFQIRFYNHQKVFSNMPVYLVIDITIKDACLYSEYIFEVSDIIEKYGGKYLVRGGRVTELSGGWVPDRFIIVEFESKERVIECLRSEEYRKIAHLRRESTVGKTIIAEGISEQVHH